MLLARLLNKLRHKAGSDDLPVGTVVAGRYRVLRPLGRGAWSAIYEVEHVGSRQRFALKQTRVAQLDAAERAAVLNELRLLASLHHPNVLQYNASFMEGGAVNLLMDVVAGGSLADLIRRHAEQGRRIPEAEVRTYLLQAARGLAHMHRHLVVHRDIKPANLLLGARGLLKIADLGVAGVVDPQVCEQTMIGTSGFMAPELYRRECQTTAADIFSLGVCLFELCALRSPLAGAATSEAALDAAAARWGAGDAAAAAASLAGRYSPELVGLLQAMLQPDPQARPSAAQILQQFATPKRLAALPAPPLADSCGRAWEEQASDPPTPRLYKETDVPADLQQLSAQLPPPCCGRAGF